MRSDAGERPAFTQGDPLAYRQLADMGLPSASKLSVDPKPRGPGSSPCFLARGRFDAGSYVSVEDGSTFTGCGPTGYVVVLMSGPKGDAGVRATLDKARKLFPAAAIVTDQVYLGCIH